jgi:hypothetical protein
VKLERFKAVISFLAVGAHNSSLQMMMCVISSLFCAPAETKKA